MLNYTIGHPQSIYVPPKYDILLKGDKRVAVVPRSISINDFEMQNVSREIAWCVNFLLDENVRNKRLTIIEQSKVEAWLDNANNDFDILEVGRDKSIRADIVMGFDILEFRIHDPQNASLLQGRCEVHVQAIDCATGEILATETLTIIDPPNMPLLASSSEMESHFHTQFIKKVVAEYIGRLFYHHDKYGMGRVDAADLEMHRLN